VCKSYKTNTVNKRFVRCYQDVVSKVKMNNISRITIKIFKALKTLKSTHKSRLCGHTQDVDTIKIRNVDISRKSG